MTEPTHDISLEGFIKSFDRRYPTFILKTLLCDRTTGRNIIWADNEYEALGDGYMGDDEITVEKITGMNSGVIKPRIAKEQERQSQRTKSRAEVFTPSWLCNQMNNDLDEAWFGRRDVFNTEVVADDDVKTWMATAEPVTFPKSKGRGWHAYVEAPRLEITCGEAPFVCSRYDTVTGDELPVGERVGFLDRKLRIVTEKAKTRKEWGCRALDALRATYGFEYQGDNLLIARINVLETFAEHFRDRWGSDPERDELEQAAWIVSWNFWQMNGFTDAVPTNKMGAEVESTLGTFEEPEPEPIQPSLFDLFDDMFTGETTEEAKEEEPKERVPLCVIYDWQNGEPFEFATLKGKAAAMGKKFYAVIGNPPYQETVEGTSDKPIYNYFMDEAYKVSARTELITPRRFLFDAGKTPKAWNQKMLSDCHLKILYEEQDSQIVFPNTQIKGGVVVTLRDETVTYGAIGLHVEFAEMNTIFGKVKSVSDAWMPEIGSSQNSFKLTNALYVDHPELEGVMSKGHRLDLKSNALAKLGAILFESKPDDGHDYGKLLGRLNNRRELRFINRAYLTDNSVSSNLDRFKVALPKAVGSGKFGEAIPDVTIAGPGTAMTETFISFGAFETEEEAENLAAYVRAKFTRAMLSLLRITQDNTVAKWAYVPLQDFTSASDIDWTQSVADIDRQLYAKYGLNDEEIAFIESHVKEMD
ncbi:Eco57I restriction-modification methylase domain-containing protein [uncultured Bifidobacterium sp.]|uniref:Eco57I restriction-modification methylase domain-containing protein n=1 Tax=uncultured Bifidobacterium sp. TaxID=165187 RepID=UPI0025EA8FF9|nr:Eco57I restriction-modification methylase domain-containing protein [uncultured Bifidobacterium sp.]